MAALKSPPEPVGPTSLLSGAAEEKLFTALTEYIAEQVAAQVDARLRETAAQKNGDEMLSVAEVAALKKRDAKTIRRWISEGLAATKRGHSWVIRRSDLDSFKAGKAAQTAASEKARILGSIARLHP